MFNLKYLFILCQNKSNSYHLLLSLRHSTYFNERTKTLFHERHEVLCLPSIPLQRKYFETKLVDDQKFR